MSFTVSNWIYISIARSRRLQQKKVIHKIYIFTYKWSTELSVMRWFMKWQPWKWTPRRLLGIIIEVALGDHTKNVLHLKWHFYSCRSAISHDTRGGKKLLNWTEYPVKIQILSCLWGLKISVSFWVNLFQHYHNIWPVCWVFHNKQANIIWHNFKQENLAASMWNLDMFLPFWGAKIKFVLSQILHTYFCIKCLIF